jgi:hypothetical protein
MESGKAGLCFVCRSRSLKLCLLCVQGEGD